MIDQIPVQFDTTLRYRHPLWDQQSRRVPLPYMPSHPHTLWDEVHYMLNVVRAARTAKVLLLNSSAGHLYPDLLASIILGFWSPRQRPMIALTGAMWDVTPGLIFQLKRLVVRLADRAIDRYIVQSTEELTEFPCLWHVDQDKMRLCLYFYTFKASDLEAPEPPPANYIFAGGNSQRDYQPLLEAARQMPEQEFFLATKLILHHDLPPNVTVKEVSHAEFVALMRAAKAVVIPLRSNMTRAAGQQTYLNAMLLRKPTIINQSFGVHDHLRDKENALIVDGSPHSYVEAIRWVLDPANQDQVACLREAAYHSAHDQYTYENHVRCLLDTLQEMAHDPKVRARHGWT